MDQDRAAEVGWARGAAARVAGDDAPAAEAHRRWPNSALRGSNRPGFGSMMDYVLMDQDPGGMRDPPMACAGLGKARGGGFDGGGSSARRRSPGRTRWAALGLGSGRKSMARAWGTYRGSKSSKAAMQGRWRRRRAARAVRCPWTSRCRGPPGLLAPREASGSSC